MRLLIVEDEPPIAEYIAQQVRSLMGNNSVQVDTAFTYADALDSVRLNQYDLCLLDLNLKGKDGFGVLEHFSSLPVQTIIISAHTEKAINAYEYGVIDFVPKPFDNQRLKLALDRYWGKVKNEKSLKYLVYRKQNKNFLLPVENIVYFEADSYLVNAHLKDGTTKVIEKSLKHLERILPDNFMRVHRSYIVDLPAVESYYNSGGGVYFINLVNGESIPLSRNGVKILSQYLKNK